MKLFPHRHTTLTLCSLGLLLILLGVHGCGGGDGGGDVVVDDTGSGNNNGDDLPKPFQPRNNDTGVTLCGGNLFNTATCPLANFPGQDGDHGRDANTDTNLGGDGHLGFSFTKLDAAGNTLASDANSWACVRDEVTGLIWEAKTDDWGIHDGRIGFAWGDHSATSCATLTACNTDTLIAAVNSEALCGYNGWRLPKMEELQSITDYGQVSPEPLLDTDYFPHYRNAGGTIQTYWSSSLRFNSLYAWNFNAANSAVIFGSVASYLGVRLVLGGTSPGGTLIQQTGQTCNAAFPATTPNERYIDQRNGTVTDKQTGLMWTRCPQGYTFSDNASPADWSDDTCTQTDTVKFTWQAALQQTGILNAAGYAGHQDWRVPNIKELYPLAEHSCIGNLMNKLVFPSTISAAYWSSTPTGDNEVWSFETFYGYLTPSAKTLTRQVLWVRDAD